MPHRSRPLARLAVALLALAVATSTAADEFSSNSERAPPPGGGPMYGNGRYGRDAECGGTDRAYYNQMYKSTAVVLSVQRSQEIYRATGGQAWYRCGACGSKVICWPRPGYEAMIAGTAPPPSGGAAPAPGLAPAAPNGFSSVPARFELSVDDDNPAAASLAQADAIAGDIISGLRFLYGDARINALSVPQSHQSNVETAALDYLNKVALGAVVARLTRGQVKNFIGRVGDEIMAKVFPNAQRQVRLADFPGRILDQLEGMTAREIKTGGFGVGKRLKEEIEIDARLVQAGYRVEWWNVRSPLGRQSFSPELIALLQQRGIIPISHINP